MELTLKQNINKESVVLKHKIALETTTLLEGREKLLHTDHMLYTMISFVDNFIEEELLELINTDEREFTVIVEDTIEPFFNELMKEEENQALFYEILDYVDEFKFREENRRTSAIGFLDYLLEIIGSFDWEDLKFFFHHITEKAQDVIEKEEPKPVPTRDEFEGADAKMKELIQRFQRQSQEINKQNNE